MQGVILLLFFGNKWESRSMPTSHQAIITPIINKVVELQPKSVLDLGIGFGKWGSLCREYLDVWAWRFYQNEWKARIDGVEGWEKYRSPGWGNYNSVKIGNIQDVLPGLGDYELIMMIEVLEHFDREMGQSVLTEIFKHSKSAIISYSNCDQHNVRGNDLEDHKSQWCHEDLAVYGVTELLYQDGVTSVFHIKNQN